MPEYKSKAFHKVAFKKFLALCQTASKTFPGTLPKLPSKTFPALQQNCL
jgi:hypothetical protein